MEAILSSCDKRKDCFRHSWLCVVNSKYFDFFMNSYSENKIGVEMIFWNCYSEFHE